MSLLVAGVVLAGLLALMALGSLIETTFIRLGRARAAGLDKAAGLDPDGNPGKTGLAVLVDDRDAVIGPAQVLRIGAQAAAVATVAVAAANRGGVVTVVLAAAVTAAATFALGEGVARRWGIEANDRTARRLARPARLTARIWPLAFAARALSWPARALGPRTRAEGSSDVVEPELVAMASAAAQASLIEYEEASLIGSIIELGDTLVRAVMVPRTDMKTVAKTDTVDRALGVVVDTGYTRLPVVGDDVDDICGIAHAKDLLSVKLAGRGGETIETSMRAVNFVPETKRAAELMREMQETQSHLAIVVDEYGGTAGLVTLEDIIEEVIGEIFDEFDSDVPLVLPLGDGTLQLSGRMPVSQLAEVLGIPVPDGDSETLAGLLLDLAGRVPEPGEVIDVGGTPMTARDVAGRRINFVTVPVTATAGRTEEPVAGEPAGSRPPASVRP